MTPAMKDRNWREPHWTRAAADPARPVLREALFYRDLTPGAPYGQLLQVKALVWQDPDHGWRYLVGVHLAGHDGETAHCTLPEPPPCPDHDTACREARYAVENFRQVPTLTGVAWLSAPLGTQGAASER